MTAGYAELHVTTNYSFLRGASHPEELFAAVAVLGLPALGVTDRNLQAGVVRAWEAARATGPCLVVGCRLDLVQRRRRAGLPDRPARLRPIVPVADRGREEKGAGKGIRMPTRNFR